MRGNGRSRLALVAALTLTVSVLPGCGGDSMGPAPSVDLAGTQAAFDTALDQYLHDNPGLNSLEIFGGDIGNALADIANSSSRSAPSSLNGLNPPRKGIRAVVGHATSLPMLVANIPTDSLGTTFEYDTVQSRYVASDRTGAPSDGVRFVLYDRKTGPSEVGYVDLSGESILDPDAPTVDIMLKALITAASPTMPVLDYHATGTSSETAGSLSFSGFLSDGDSQLDFNLDISGSGSTVDGASFALSAGDLAMTFQKTAGRTPNQTLETSIGSGLGVIRFFVEIDANDDIQDGSGVFLNDGSGEVFVAKFAGSIGQATQLTNAEGNPLTQKELVALANIFVAIEYSFALVKELSTIGLTLVGVLSFF